MLSSTFLPAVLALAAVGAQAIDVTYPSDKDTWTSSGSQTVKWTSVDTDADTFAMVLVNQDSSFLASTATLNENVTTSLNTLDVTFPDGDFPVGTRFQVNFLRSLTQNTAILAQSDYFNITQSEDAVTSTSASVVSSVSASVASVTKSVVSAASTASVGTMSTVKSVVSSASNVAASAKASASSEAAGASGGLNIPNASATTTSAAGLSTSSPAKTLFALLGLVGGAFLL